MSIALSKIKKKTTTTKWTSGKKHALRQQAFVAVIRETFTLGLYAAVPTRHLKLHDYNTLINPRTLMFGTNCPTSDRCNHQIETVITHNSIPK